MRSIVTAPAVTDDGLGLQQRPARRSVDALYASCRAALDRRGGGDEIALVAARGLEI